MNEPNESLSSWGMWHVPDEVNARAKQFESLAAYVQRQQENNLLSLSEHTKQMECIDFEFKQSDWMPAVSEDA